MEGDPAMSNQANIKKLKIYSKKLNKEVEIILYDQDQEDLVKRIVEKAQWGLRPEWTDWSRWANWDDWGQWGQWHAWDNAD